MPDTPDRPFARYTHAGLRPLGIPAGDTARHGYGPRVFALCGYQCAYCGYEMSKPYENWLNLSVDHVVPAYLAKVGWPREWVLDKINLVTACRACNEFLNGYRVTDTGQPATLPEFTEVGDRVFDEKLDAARKRHELERQRYVAARAAGPTEAQEDVEAPTHG